MSLQQYILAHLPLVYFGARMILIWTLANYTWPADHVRDLRRSHPTPWRAPWVAAVSIRSLVLTSLVLWIAHWDWSLGACTLVFAILLPLVRSRISPSYLAELEIGANLSFVLAVVALAVVRGVPSVPSGSHLDSRQLAVVYIVIAVVVFSLRGGTYIVRGALNKGRILPERRRHVSAQPSTPEYRKVDVAEYNRGRIIGNIERLLLLIFVSMGAWAALAFLITAKGLFRARDLEQADFAEYFLVGTLISSLIAIVSGLGIQLAIKVLW